MFRLNYFGRGLNYFFILCIFLGILILAVPNILETVIATFLIIIGVSGLLGNKRKKFF
ncbi:hypothetical protein CMO90_01635 [Candidatus Woesearchaeota archaeon]|jgi:hypothetical protein|nr:hypothetical protein [Candidatus Woesearchaeota archaeon]